MIGTDTAFSILFFCGVLETLQGVFFFAALCGSTYDPDFFLTQLFGLKDYGPSAANAWSQVAVVFGMHCYADFGNGLRQISVAKARNDRLPRLCSVWNSARFVISLLWLLRFIDGMVTFKSTDFLTWGIGSQVLCVVLALDTLLIRPLAILAQREVEDAFGVMKNEEKRDFQSLFFIQKLCRGVFFYEAVLSGTSGATYFVFPRLFLWLYEYPAVDLECEVTAWCLSQFGVLVMTFGIYQMGAEIDTDRFMVFWWLALDFLWLFLFYQSTTARIGAWNPLTFEGGNFWIQSGFHADSSLALARTIFLLASLFNSRAPKVGPKRKQK